MGPADVDALIRSGDVIQTPKEQGGGEGSRGSWDEYWNHAIKLSELTRCRLTQCSNCKDTATAHFSTAYASNSPEA